MSLTFSKISASELYRPSERHFSAKLVPTFTDRGCRVVSAMDPHGGVLGFLDRNRNFSFQVVPQLYSRCWVDPVPNPLLLRNSSSAGNWTRSSGHVSSNSPLGHRGGRNTEEQEILIFIVWITLQLWTCNHNMWASWSAMHVKFKIAL
jgi:hypothetical protein